MKWQYIHVSILPIWEIWQTEVVPLITSNSEVITIYSTNDACRISGWIIRTIGDK